MNLELVRINWVKMSPSFPHQDCILGGQRTKPRDSDEFQAMFTDSWDTALTGDHCLECKNGCQRSR